MRGRWLMLGAVALMVGCTDPMKELEIDLGVNADLESVIALGHTRTDGWLAVGEHGTIVAFSLELKSGFERVDVRTFDIGDQHLRDVAQTFGAWWVVGDEGFGAVSEDRGKTWVQLDLGVDADLRAIVVFDEYEESPELMILGEGVVLVRGPDRSWVELPPPSGGWGDLNAAYVGSDAYGDADIYLFGDAGVAWWKDVDQSEEAEAGGDGDGDGDGDAEIPWVELVSRTEGDLIAVEGNGWQESWESADIRVFAADGTILDIGNDPGKHWYELGIDVGDLVVDSERGYTLAADGSIHYGAFGGDTGLHWYASSISGARALAPIGDYGNGSIMVVGTNGRAYEIHDRRNPPW